MWSICLVDSGDGTKPAIYGVQVFLNGGKFIIIQEPGAVSAFRIGWRSTAGERELFEKQSCW
jgi:hypothetical protein